jgi:type II secretory pathway pseudopilin PulG
MKFVTEKQKGMSLIEVVIVAAVSTLVFGALLMSFKYTLDLMNVSRSKLSALSVANDRMEFFRSLPYADVGTILGIPSGTIPQNSTSSLNGIVFFERVLVDYVDDPGDGLAGADSNAIITDYKRVKLEYSWRLNGATSSIFLVSNIVPRSIETTGGGGTVRVNVIDQDSNLLPGADVRLFNNTLGPIDITRTTDANGSVIISGAEAGGDYEIEVTANIAGDEYSQAQTYRPTLAVPTPVVSPFAVLEADVSTLTFQIGELSDLNIRTYSTLTDSLFKETFDSLATLASSSNVFASGGELELVSSFGVYETAGSAIAGPFSPGTIEEWHSLRIALDSPANTSHYVRLLTQTGPGIYAVIPDAVLPGNNVGFTSNTIDLQDLLPAVYPTLYVEINLETTNTSVSPEVEELNIFYREVTTDLGGATFNMTGIKSIGSNASGTPVAKFSASSVTSGAGEVTFADLEFDEYTLNFSGYDIATACNAHPVVHRAGVDSDVSFNLVADQTNTLRVVVTNSLGELLPGVEVELSRAGYSRPEVTNNCGQAFFSGGVPLETDFELDVVAAGYNSENITGLTVDGDIFYQVTLTE